jgi:predicted enzyme related to lactoylglutathione lyase
MKRFHVHVAVDDLPKNIGFYSALFGVPAMPVQFSERPKAKSCCG